MAPSSPTQASRKIGCPIISCSVYPKMHSAARFQLATVDSGATLMMASLESSTSAAMRCIRPYLTAGTRNSSEESIRSSRGGSELLDTVRPTTISGLVFGHAHVLIGINSMPARLGAVTFSTDGLRRAVQSDAPT